MSPHPPDVSFLDFFEHTIAGTLEKPRELESVYVGKSKDVLDKADKYLNLAQVVATFGSYVKLVTREPSTDAATVPSEEKSQPMNAFEVMFASQRRLNQPSLPSRREPVRTKKDKLRNNMIVLLEQNELSWKSCDIPSIGEQLVGNLTETLWYVDGHHDVFKNRGFQIPGVFSCFTGYNTPEASKHRKRQVGNMSDVEAECGMWRLIYSPNKLKAKDKRLLERKLDNFAFSCGTTLEELDLLEHT